MSGRPIRSIGVVEPGRPAIVDDSQPEPGPGQAWVSTEWSGVSAGTEVALVRGTDPHHQLCWDRELRAFSPEGEPAAYPIPKLGYMEVGRVTESRVPGLAEGARVAMAYGHRTGYCATPDREPVIPVPDDLDPLLGVYLAQMGPICVNGLLHAAATLAGPAAGVDAGVRGRHVLVTGAGVVGLLSAMLAVQHGAEAEPRGDREPAGRRIGDDHLGRARVLGEQRGEQADDAGAGDEDPTAAHTDAEVRDRRPADVGGGVQQAVGADRPHLGEVDPEQRIEVGGHRHDEIAGA